MPSLQWIGKESVVNHHQAVPFRLLRDVSELSVGDPGSGNLLVEGDNLVALKALLPYYAGQVKCIYIDPPYNTGNEGWIYNDNVTNPVIQKWLGEVVGGEDETLDRHDRWLCMMYPRLALLRQFLRNDGAIFVSIDDHEYSRLKLILDEIFGESAHVGTFIWKRRTTPDSRNLNGVSGDHEYIMCYQKTAEFRFKGQTKDLTKYSNPDRDPRGPWMSDNLTGLANAAERPNLHYSLIHPHSGLSFPPHPSRGWIYGPDRMAELVAENRILWPKKATGRPRLKRFVTDMRSETTGFSTVLDAPGNVEATKELSKLLGPKTFAFPKPTRLIELLLAQAIGPTDLVLDSFAGSGTTGHAVMAMNRQDGGSRRFLLVEMIREVARGVTAKRLRKVAEQGEDSTESAGSFRFCELGQELFDIEGCIRSDVSFGDLARHVFFTETGEPLAVSRVKRTPLIGTWRDAGIYLLYNGILGDRSASGGNVLTRAILAELPTYDGPKVIYCAGCLIGEDRLRTLGITVRQTPYEIRIR